MVDRPDDIATRLARRLFDRPLVQNSFRGAFVEEMLAPTLAGFGWRHCGDDWSAWDFEHEFGCRLEVKQSAAAQSWLDLKGVPTKSPSFSIEEKAGYWTGGEYTLSPGRHAQIYIFAWHPIADREIADHRKIEQWTFHLIEAKALPPGQDSIRLSVLVRLGARSASAGNFGDALDQMRQSIA